MENSLKIVVAGEVDAGKSTLIGRFLHDTGEFSNGVAKEIEDTCKKLEHNFEFAYLVDSLEEERKNERTIDTTQVFCKTKKGKGFVFIDVPGHQELLKNMLCGSSYADIAILVVDAEKSIEHQTRRHAFILKFLGIEQIVIVLNKMDLVGFNEAVFKKVREEIDRFFKKIQLQPKYVIPISANQGENLLKKSKKMMWYNGLSLLETLNTCFKGEGNGLFRFPIQDIYCINKEKLAVGRIVSGEIKKGEKVYVLPLNKECRVRAIKVFDKKLPVARSPESIGLVLDDMNSLVRGQIICKPELPRVTKEILARIFCVHPLAIKEDFSFKCVTQETNARIRQVKGVWDTDNLEHKDNNGLLEKFDVSEVVIAIENPMVVESLSGLSSLGRFVLKNSNRDICAVGVIF